jgi:hypothetical protein
MNGNIIFVEKHLGECPLGRQEEYGKITLQ